MNSINFGEWVSGMDQETLLCFGKLIRTISNFVLRFQNTKNSPNDGDILRLFTSHDQKISKFIDSWMPLLVIEN